jgi:hypothetical protein
MSIEHHKNHLAMGVLTGVTALVGGIEPASAAAINPPQSAGFDLMVSDSHTYSGADQNPDDDEGGSAGPFPWANDMATDPKSFSMFDDLGMTLMLNSVTITVETTSESLDARLTGASCSSADPGNSGGSDCSVDVKNETTFSAQVDLGGGMFFDMLLGGTTDTTKLLQTTLQSACQSSDESCALNPTISSIPVSLADFSLTITDQIDLQKFVGASFFHVVPKASLGGDYGYSWGDNDTNSGTVGAETTWGGTISVTYDYQEKPTNPVPAPATLFLFGAGVAGMGVGLRRLKKA